jgi:hypothetical protein
MERTGRRGLPGSQLAEPGTQAGKQKFLSHQKQTDEDTMNVFMKAILVGASALTLSAPNASAAIVCNDEGDCWHVRGRPNYGPELKLRIYGDDWKWSDHDRYRWREHEGHGYWRRGAWIDIR